MTVLEASVLISLLDTADAHADAADRVLATVGADALAVHRLTLAEILVAPVRAGREDAAQAAIAALEIDHEVGLGPEDPTRLAALRAGTGLRMPDCCVLLAADAVAADRVATFDARLAAVVRARDLRVVGVPVS